MAIILDYHPKHFYESEDKKIPNQEIIINIRNNLARITNTITGEIREIETDTNGYWWDSFEFMINVKTPKNHDTLGNQEFFDLVTEAVHLINEANKMTFDGGCAFLLQHIEEINARFI